MILQVIRVLNLWQKNEVFPSDVIQPLFDLANPNSEIYRRLDEQIKLGGGKLNPMSTSMKSGGMIHVAPEFRMAEMGQDDHGNVATPSSSVTDQQVSQQLQTILHLLKNHAQPNNEQVKFNKKLLDFDYSDEEDAAESGEQQPSPAMLEALQG